MSQFIEVEIKISDLVHDLRQGLTWFASEDRGHGSIQDKYEMEDEDIIDIKGHPAFNQPIRTFKIVDDYTKKPAEKKSRIETAITEQPQISAAVEESLFPITETTEEVSHMSDPETSETAGALEFMSI